jgi:hypothetical protein
VQIRVIRGNKKSMFIREIRDKRMLRVFHSRNNGLLIAFKEKENPIKKLNRWPLPFC